MDPDNVEGLLRVLVSLIGRMAFPQNELLPLVSPKNLGRRKAVEAFNLCDGTKTQAQVAAAIKLDPGNLSRMVSRWKEAGILYELGNRKAPRLLHVRPVALKGDKKG